MLSHNLPVKIEPQQNEAYNTKFKTNIVWKQKLKDPHFEATASPKWRVNPTYGTYTISNNKLTYTITTKNANEAIIQDSVSFTQGHIYLLSCWLTVSEDQVVGAYTGNSVTNLANLKANVRTRIFNVFKSNITSTRTCYIYPARNGGLAIGGTAVLEDACLYDLTEMFGEGKEVLGRFSFLSNFPNNYYDYNVDGDLVPFTIPVYGGSINIKTGLLQITKYNLDLGYLYWQYSAAQASTGKYRKACTEVLFEATSSTSDVPDLISSGYQTLSNAVSYQFTQGIAIATNSTIYICDERYSAQNDMPAFANAVKGITACGVMASPVTYNLTPVEVKTLLGNNKISSNATELQLTYKNSQNENVSLTGNNEYAIGDGVFDRTVESATNLFSPKQNLNGWTCPYFSGLGPIKLDFEPVQGSESGVDYDTTQRVYGDNFVLFDSHGNAPSASSGIDVNIPVRNGNFYNQGKSTLSISIPTAHWPDRQVTLDNLMLYVKLLNEEMGIQDGIFIYDLNEPISFTDTLSINSKIGYVQLSLYKRDTETFLPVFLPLNIQYDYSDTVIPINYNVLPAPHYSNICPIEGYTESSVTVEGDRVPDSESERRLKAITRPVFQWDFGLKLKFEGYSFADGTLCQFDNKITAYSLNATIENNECTIPYQLLDENCQGDIVAYINVSGNDYDVVVYEVYIPVIKRQKPENFLRPAIDLPSAVIASFTDGADDVPLEKLKIAVTPKQDLHGYDYPWVGGGGNNKLNYDVWKTVNITRGTAVWENNGVTLTATANDCYTYYQASVFPEGARIPVQPGDVVTLSWEESTNKAGGCYIFADGDTGNYHGENNNTRKTCQLTVASGKTYVTIRMGVQNAGDTISYKNIMVQVNSSATAYEPYENICPITGHTSASVVRAGRNLWPFGDLSGTGNSGGLSFNPDLPAVNTKYTVSGVFTSTDTDASTNNFAVQFTSGSNYLQMTRGARNSKSTTRTNEAIRQARLYASSSSALSANDTFTGTDIQFEIGTSASPYEPYKGEVFTIPFTHEGPNVFTTEGSTLDRYINGNGQESTSSNYRITAYIPVEPNKRYVYDANNARFSTTVYHAYFDANKQLITSVHAMQEGFYIPSNVYYVRLSYRKDEVPTDFHISIGTVPHGTLDIKTGILTQDYAFVSDMSNMHWRLNSSTYPGVFRSDYYLGNIYGPTTASGRIRGFSCSCYKPMDEDHAGSGSNSTPYAMMRYNGALFIRNDDYVSDATSFKASLEGQQVIYELDRESPAIYQLTPTEVKTLLGYNNIWADTGEVEVSYYADPYLHFID